ncbi:MAG: hypothetical protein IJT70_03210 [Clostridia bacterium]|nr:hypothetical protein [Clostridia bacterium]
MDPINNEEEINRLKDENVKLLAALRDIKAHLEGIDKLFEELSDIISDSDTNAPATDDEIKDLLKRYSRIQ